MSTTSESFKMVQFNVENLFVYMDFFNQQKLNNLTEVEWQNLSSSTVSNKSLVKTKWLAESIKDMAPDLMLLCEVGGYESLKNFVTHFLEDAYEILFVEGNSDRGIDVAYLLKKTWKFPTLLISHKDAPLAFNYNFELKMETPKTHFFSRDALELRLYDKDPQKPWLCCFNLHLKSKLDPERRDPSGKKRRRAEVETFAKIFRKSQEELGPDCRYVIAADFNGIHSPKHIAENEFEDLHALNEVTELFEALQVPKEERYTQIQFLSGGRVVPLQIDGFWISKNLLKYVVKEETKVYLYKTDLGIQMPYVKSLQQRLAMPSDHYPVMTSLKIRDLLGS